MIMYMDLILKTLKSKLLGKLLVWMDNASLHKTEAVKDVLKELRLFFAFYPVKMTSVMQILDLVI